MVGYDNIPEFWLKPLDEIWNLDFEGTTVSLDKGAHYSYNQALQLIEKNGGCIEGDNVVIPQEPVTVLPLEQNFINTYPIYRERWDCWMDKEFEFDFEGNGYIIWGNLVKTKEISPRYAHMVAIRHIGSEPFALAELDDPYVAEIEVWIDGQLEEVSIMPMMNTARKLEPSWKYQMPEGHHTVKLVWRNPHKDYLLRINDIQYYSEKENTNQFYYYAR